MLYLYHGGIDQLLLLNNIKSKTMNKLPTNEPAPGSEVREKAWDEMARNKILKIIGPPCSRQKGLHAHIVSAFIEGARWQREQLKNQS